MPRERDAAVLQVARQGRLSRRVFPPAQETDERRGRVVAHQDRLPRGGRRDRTAGAGVEPPPERPREQPLQEGARAQLNTTTPRATCPVRRAVKPSLMSSSLQVRVLGSVCLWEP